MKLVVLVVGALLLISSIIWGGLSVGNDFAAAGLFLFCLSASSYFIAWPVSRDEEQNWRFNLDFAWFSIYLLVSAISAMWLILLL